MSLETWEKLYYPVDAHSVTEEDALAHVQQKWLGLKPEVLEEHGLLRTDSILRGDDNWFHVDADSCALCHWHLDEGEDDDDGLACDGTCPLERVRGTPCDQPNEDSPYCQFAHSGDPAPMLALIREAIAAEGES